MERKRASRARDVAEAESAGLFGHGGIVGPVRVMIAPQHIWTVETFNQMMNAATTGYIRAIRLTGQRVTPREVASIREQVMANFNNTIIPAGNA